MGVVEPPSLIETLRYEGAYLRLERHWARLAASARELGHVWRPERVRCALDEAAAGRRGAWRVRLLLPADGRPRWQARPLPPSRPEPVLVGLATARIDGRDPWRRHKTTRRETYDAATAQARRLGLADLLFLDADGYLVEGAVSTVFVRLGPRIVTPPVQRGALPGVLRAELLARGWAQEADVIADALRDAAEIWIGNSLRGLRRAHLAPPRIPVEAASP